jgi:hypothetical protein
MSNTHKSSTRPARPARDNPSVPTNPATGLRKRHPMVVTLLPVALVIVAIATMVAIKTTGGSTPADATAPVSKAVPGVSTPAGNADTTALAAGVLTDVTSVSPSTFAAVGSPKGLAVPTAIPKSQPLLTAADGTPEILYVGAEYCPFCAAERWAVVVALSRFGDFSGLSATHSSTSDVYPDTKTFSFYGSTFTSQFLNFTPVEEETNQRVGSAYSRLQTPTGAESAIQARYDAAPYTSYPGSIPFLDIGNRYLVVGASYTPQILQGLSMQSIAKQLNDPTSLVATAVDGTANEITASICAMTGDQPTSVCASPTIEAMAKKLGV